MKAPEKRSAPVYAGCSQHPNTHRSATHLGSHMHPPQDISGAVPVQEALSLCPSAALPGVLLARDRADPRSGQGHDEGTWGLSALEAPLWDDPADGPVEPVGRRSRHDADGDDNAAHASTAGG